MKRNKQGKFARDLTLYRWFIYASVFGFIVVLTSVGINRLAEAAQKALTMTIEVQNVNASEVATPDPTPKPLTLMEKIESYATKYHVSSYQMKRTIECETHFKNEQSRVVKNGIRERSYGLAQINIPAHPGITVAQAMNIDFSLNFMASHFYTTKWYAYDRVNDKCN